MKDTHTHIAHCFWGSSTSSSSDGALEDTWKARWVVDVVGWLLTSLLGISWDRMIIIMFYTSLIILIFDGRWCMDMYGWWLRNWEGLRYSMHPTLQARYIFALKDRQRCRILPEDGSFVSSLEVEVANVGAMPWLKSWSLLKIIKVSEAQPGMLIEEIDGNCKLQ